MVDNFWIDGLAFIAVREEHFIMDFSKNDLNNLIY